MRLGNTKFKYTVEGSLVHLYMCRNVVFTGDTSGHGECKHDMWSILRGNNYYVLEQRVFYENSTNCSCTINRIKVARSDNKTFVRQNLFILMLRVGCME